MKKLKLEHKFLDIIEDTLSLQVELYKFRNPLKKKYENLDLSIELKEDLKKMDELFLYSMEELKKILATVEEIKKELI